MRPTRRREERLQAGPAPNFFSSLARESGAGTKRENPRIKGEGVDQRAARPAAILAPLQDNFPKTDHFLRKEHEFRSFVGI